MTSTIIVSAIVFLALLALIQFVLVAIYCRALARVDGKSDRSFQPPATVIVCLRGADPYLQNCLLALSNQRYDQYDLLCVLDDSQDPAAEVLDQIRERGDSNCRIEKLIAGEPSGHCSLKCHSLVSAMQQIDESVDVVALADADTIADPYWLRDLVAPLANPEVAVSSGNRWYQPPDHRMGTLVRYIWNLAASVQMYLYRIPWGGSLAMRMNYWRDTDLKQHWERAMFEDTMLAAHVKQHGRRIAMVPSLLVANRESIDYRGALQWICRQLLNVRLYHPKSILTALHCFATSGTILVLLLGGITATMTGVVAGDWSLAWGAWAALAGYLLYYVVIWNWLERSATRVISLRRDRRPPQSLTWRLTWAIAVTQWVYTGATISAMFLKRISWRGVQYLIRKPFDVTIIIAEKTICPSAGRFYKTESIEH